MTTDEKLKQAIDELGKITSNETNRYAYLHQEKQLRDYINDVLSNREEGVKITAKRFKEKNIDYSIISQCTDLTYEQIDAL